MRKSTFSLKLGVAGYRTHRLRKAVVWVGWEAILRPLVFWFVYTNVSSSAPTCYEWVVTAGTTVSAAGTTVSAPIAIVHTLVSVSGTSIASISFSPSVSISSFWSAPTDYVTGPIVPIAPPSRRWHALLIPSPAIVVIC